MSPETCAPSRSGPEPSHSGACTRTMANAAASSPTAWFAHSMRRQSRGVRSTAAAMTAKATQWARSNRPCMRP